MKKITTNSLIMVSSVAAVLLLNNCTGEETTWGIDQGELIPVCSADANDTSSAIVVSKGSTVTSMESGTSLRAWHYENGDKLVCVLTGAAKVSVE